MGKSGVREVKSTNGLASVKNTKSQNTRVKGFSIIELIIVMGILAILVSISAMGVNGFLRQANIRTYNKAAETAYRSVQNVIIDREIYQDDSEMFPAGFFEAPNATNKYLVVAFTVQPGNTVTFTGGGYARNMIDGVKLRNGFSGAYPDNGRTSSSDYVYTSSSSVGKKWLKALSDNLGGAPAGTYAAWIDYANYTVIGVIYDPDNYNHGSVTANVNGQMPVVGCGTLGGSSKVFTNGTDQTSKFKTSTTNVKCGVYPYVNDYADGTSTVPTYKTLWGN